MNSPMDYQHSQESVSSGTPEQACFQGMSKWSCEAMGERVGNGQLQCPTAEACTLRREHLFTRGMDAAEYPGVDQEALAGGTAVTSCSLEAECAR